MVKPNSRSSVFLLLVPNTCSELPRPSENFTLEASSNSSLVAGCHSDFQINSQATYACTHDSSIKVQTICNAFGEWDPPLVDTAEWPNCKSSGIYHFSFEFFVTVQWIHHTFLGTTPHHNNCTTFVLTVFALIYTLLGIWCDVCHGKD